MSTTWSRIHAQLGEAPGELTYKLIASAVAEQLPEAEELDWKQALPHKEEAEEFAKDVAAMANTSGGLIVYGVVEDRGTGRAKSLQSVDISERTQRRLRALAANRIHPPVLGLDIVPLSSDDGQTNLLALSIPRSPDAPHVIGQKNHLGVPYRDGPETQWMRERDLERAYANRFTRREHEHAASRRDDRGSHRAARTRPSLARGRHEPADAATFHQRPAEPRRRCRGPRRGVDKDL